MSEQKTQLVVIGGGPGGYAAAFYAADLGLQVTLVELEKNPGGVCLYRGCIPSKALLHVAKLLNETKHASAWGIEYSKPKINLDKLRDWKQSVVTKLTGGLGVLTKRRNCNIDLVPAADKKRGVQALEKHWNRRASFNVYTNPSAAS